jgi:hypothetical protein
VHDGEAHDDSGRPDGEDEDQGDLGVEAEEELAAIPRADPAAQELPDTPEQAKDQAGDPDVARQAAR